jgi:hypothetical protein
MYNNNAAKTYLICVEPNIKNAGLNILFIINIAIEKDGALKKTHPTVVMLKNKNVQMLL